MIAPDVQLLPTGTVLVLGVPFASIDRARRALATARRDAPSMAQRIAFRRAESRLAAVERLAHGDAS